MVVCVVRAEHLQRIPRQFVATVVVDCLERRDDKEQHSLAGAHVRNPFGNPGSAGVKQEALDGMVVQRAEREWHIEPVVPGVELLVEVGVRVHCPVQEVLPSVDDEPADGVLSDA